MRCHYPNIAPIESEVGITLAGASRIAIERAVNSQKSEWRWLGGPLTADLRYHGYLQGTGKNGKYPISHQLLSTHSSQTSIIFKSFFVFMSSE